MMKYVCVCCVRFVLINLRHCGKPCACLSPVLNLVCYVWLYYSWLFVFNHTVLSCVAACYSLVGLLVIPASGGSSPGTGGHAPRPRWRPDNFFRQYINIITKPTAYDGPREY